MADYDDAVVRAVLRDHGQEPPVRGKLGSQWIDQYEAIVAGQDGEVPPPDELGEYDAGVSAADFPDDDEPLPVKPEQRPRRVRQSKPSLGTRLRGATAKGKSKAKRKHPRVPVDRLIGRFYETCGRIITPAMPPVGRTIQWQAPVAGLIFEDMVRDTVADRALQPIARAEELAEKGAAILGLPAVIAALTAAQGLPEDQRLVRQAFLIPLARELIVMNIKIMGDKAEEMAARQAEVGPLNARADEILGMFFADLTVTVEQQRMAEEDAKAPA